MLHRMPSLAALKPSLIAVTRSPTTASQTASASTTPSPFISQPPVLKATPPRKSSGGIKAARLRAQGRDPSLTTGQPSSGRSSASDQALGRKDSKISSQQHVPLQATATEVITITAQVERLTTAKDAAAVFIQTSSEQDQQQPALKRHKVDEAVATAHPVVSDPMPVDPPAAAEITPQSQATEIAPPSQLTTPPSTAPVQRNLLAELGLAEGEVQLLGSWQLPAEPEAAAVPSEPAEAAEASQEPAEDAKKRRPPARKQLTEEERAARAAQHQIYELINAGSGLRRDWVGPGPVDFLQSWCEQHQVILLFNLSGCMLMQLVLSGVLL
ncbi:hypothetical protein MMC07_006573 [Pseudocyphellaria aurata]|nr:hypothetical protein [Pseudocyphellaria aurata]